jgi:hypothetical protein
MTNRVPADISTETGDPDVRIGSFATDWLGYQIGPFPECFKSRHALLPPPTLRERRHRGLARWFIAVRRAAYVAVRPQGSDENVV